MRIQLYGNNLPLAIIRRAQKGDQVALRQIVTHYLPRIRKEVTRYRSLPYEEGVAVGCEGLLRGLPKFNPKICKDFWKYVFFWVRAYMIKEVKRIFQCRRDTMVCALTDEHPFTERVIAVQDQRFDEFEEDDEYREVLRIANRTLSTKERDVLQRRLDGVTLQRTGDQLGISRERVRQIEFKIHHKIREAMTT